MEFLKLAKDRTVWRAFVLKLVVRELVFPLCTAIPDFRSENLLFIFSPRLLFQTLFQSRLDSLGNPVSPFE